MPTTTGGPSRPLLRPGTNSSPAVAFDVVVHRSGTPSPLESPDAVSSGRAVGVHPVAYAVRLAADPSEAGVSVDPMVDYGQPATMNPYAYSNNAPATFSDPTGEFFPVLIGIAARIAIQAAIIAARKAAQAAARRAAALASKRALDA
ncbi:hypothetical protein [Streptomyces cahuitamycinicus]|uniref:hypothetical protein n=1 Tax=Streptomyces cahuitamycinicus TaxID=2070367 RepID=UPI0011AEC882|nr:hypothetical protein [Streptomyces cahuitamycinicus]